MDHAVSRIRFLKVFYPTLVFCLVLLAWNTASQGSIPNNLRPPDLDNLSSRLPGFLTAFFGEEPKASAKPRQKLGQDFDGLYVQSERREARYLGPNTYPSTTNQ